MTAGRRSLVALVAAAAMLVPAAAAPAAGSRIVLVTQNVRVTLGPVHARHDVRQAARGADVLALQEMNRRRVTRYLPASWHAWQARGPAGETAVAWRPARFRLIGGVPLLLHRSTLFRSATRYAAAVMLVERGSNRCLTVVSVHMAPHIDAAGRLTSLRRGKLAAIALRTFAAAGRMLGRGCAVAIGGDWNLDAYASRRARDPGPCTRG
jgi:endonuclease/exonuclease/phosphatase family metal-dependent hydrolase